jgi:hypothetical protein
MSATKTFEVKIQLKGGTSIITIVHAESDFPRKTIDRNGMGRQNGEYPLC